ncbi:aminodeoxychorismate synthase component I [Chromobacterium sp. IIBBL 290-4]|uniref:aminodeoxychorismate synthase component I n=1 Tax=Chromobacterium sp. IIBBL 290-4 TaxID=2953890 RepID=UPI0020B8DE45|nr:aminodeoxychorismate synthase component I [Chromobacterium sp. IIBBL 290-4]UTH72694.1 aminodeoxychorismate synthase component I [Chromobacterium sp. IIBBL 290-4]
MFTQKLDFIPDLLALHAAERERFPYLMQSSGDKGWDMLLMQRERRVYMGGEGQAFLDEVRAFKPQPVSNPHQLPFVGGWFVYLAYDLLSEFEPHVPQALPDTFPLAVWARTPAAVLVDRARQEAWLVGETADEWHALERLVSQCPLFTPSAIALAGLEEDPPEWYTEAVTRLKSYIYEGDVFQVNISRGWRAELAEGIAAPDLYAALRRANPAPFSALADFGEAQIVSSSPERLVRVRDGWAETRPIAGTHPRSQDPAEDAALKKRLITSIKERAEHVMLIDLERNDLGRISKPGTVEVNELMAVASYAYVHHIESNVRGKLRDDVAPADVLRALFPGGTITGCPKVRTMQIIRELENSARRAYTGSLGYLNRDGSMDFNILIRSFMQEGSQLRFRAGGGIVADSDPERELMETRHKARGLLRALGVDGV